MVETTRHLLLDVYKRQIPSVVNFTNFPQVIARHIDTHPANHSYLVQKRSREVIAQCHTFQAQIITIFYRPGRTLVVIIVYRVYILSLIHI